MDFLLERLTAEGFYAQQAYVYESLEIVTARFLNFGVVCDARR